MMQTIWHGTDSERDRLLAAIGRYCDCTKDSDGKVLTPCELHICLSIDQRFINGMLWGMRLRDRYIAEEYMM